MHAGRRIVLAISGILVLVLIVYYGFFTTDESLPDIVVHDPAGDRVIDPTELAPPPAREMWDEPEANRSGDRQPPAESHSSSAPMIAMGQSDPVGVTPVHSSAEPGYLTAPTRRELPIDREGEEYDDGGKDPPALPLRGSIGETGTGRDLTRGDVTNRDPGGADDEGEASHAASPGPPAQPPLRTNRPAQVEVSRAPVDTTYTVRSGDTMSSIAVQWFGDERKWDLIAQANPLVDPLRLQIGHQLRLPPKDASRTEARVAAAGAAGGYTVRPGDTLSSIARRHYGDEALWRVIYEANRRSIGRNPDTLKVGMTLTIPRR